MPCGILPYGRVAEVVLGPEPGLHGAGSRTQVGSEYYAPGSERVKSRSGMDFGTGMVG